MDTGRRLGTPGLEINHNSNSQNVTTLLQWFPNFVEDDAKDQVTTTHSTTYITGQKPPCLNKPNSFIISSKQVDPLV